MHRRNSELVQLLPVKLGQTYMTCGVQALVAEGLNVTHFLSRHQKGDWGDLGTEDWRANDRGLKHGTRLFSSYYIDSTKTTKIWIISEADRSMTTILLPGEY